MYALARKPRQPLLAASAVVASASLAPAAFAATYVAKLATDQGVPPSGFPATATGTFDDNPGTRKLMGSVDTVGVVGTSSLTSKAVDAACGATGGPTARDDGVRSIGTGSAGGRATLHLHGLAALACAPRRRQS